jgi:hypothetical protein
MISALHCVAHQSISGTSLSNTYYFKWYCALLVYCHSVVLLHIVYAASGAVGIAAADADAGAIAHC